MKDTEYFLADIDSLIPYARNARTHSEAQIAQIAASIKEFGFLSPIIIAEDNTILCGHGRYYGAQKLGLKKVPCVRESHLTETQRRAYILADNKLSLNAGWDNEMLAVELSELQENDFDLSLTGFDADELAELFDNDADAKEDDFDVEGELRKPCFSKAGDLWKLGRHTVFCGDSTDPNSFERLMNGTKANLVLTDASFYEFYATAKSRIFYDAFEDAGFKVGAGLVWKKPRFPLSRTDWKFNMEPIIFGWRKDGRHKWYGDQKQTAVFEFDGIRNSKEDGFEHPSSKPVSLLAYLIKLSTQPNGVVLDGFLGSASTLIACEQLDRICYGIEIEPKFVDVAVKRYLQFQNGKADDITLLRDGKEHSGKALLQMMEVSENGQQGR